MRSKLFFLILFNPFFLITVYSQNDIILSDTNSPIYESERNYLGINLSPSFY